MCCTWSFWVSITSAVLGLITANFGVATPSWVFGLVTILGDFSAAVEAGLFEKSYTFLGVRIGYAYDLVDCAIVDTDDTLTDDHCTVSDSTAWRYCLIF